MLEDALPSIWASVHGWFTPAVFFVLLNVVIGSIAVTSTRSHHTATSADDGGPTTTHASKLFRFPSLVLDRVKSFNLSSYRSQNPQTQIENLDISTPPPTVTAAVEVQPPPVPVEESHIYRSRSDTRPVAGEILKKLPKKMKKSASARSAFSHFEFGEAEEEGKTTEIEDRRPATARPAPSAAEEEEEEEEETGEVDARADDFINMFRNQLKLQRMDSMVRYKEMIKRGGNQ